VAAKDIAFALHEIGFETMDKAEDADSIALFSIDTVVTTRWQIE
jgi:hypothetical protein